MGGGGGGALVYWQKRKSDQVLIWLRHKIKMINDSLLAWGLHNQHKVVPNTVFLAGYENKHYIVI